ncbi:NADH:ubiquinone oxidoreductase subunit C [Streptomyces sp. B3I7]|uniref:NADH-quinone oxidoreductase subunit C n=1 Tax=Streptomyces sp. B3I7 TaxID=3042269 RepID=UPI0027859EBC|nr:NADH-quinone oxidoreductase subunit C [Streptomyces sp. B3I7]MDQ0811848.1 NADH:ubiquinone oxidoreductase subunit C [Streptomyces sp. B3I7]
MTGAGWLPAPVGELFGPEATAEEAYDLLTVDVPPTEWITALRTARSTLACTYFDWLSAVDEPGTGFRVSAHVVALSPVRRLMVRTTVPHEAPVLPTAVDVYAGAGWHERETHEMFGVDFEGHPALDHLLLPETFEGHPLRKDFVLAARVAKAWPGAKEPGESEHGGPKRRQMLPPGVPDPNEWGPLKGQLPAAPSRPARGARAAGDRPARTPGERPPRRARTASQGSTSQAPGATGSEVTAPESTAPAQAPPAEGTAPARPPRRARSAGEGSASPRTEADTTEPPRPNRAADTNPADGASRTGGTDPIRGANPTGDTTPTPAPRDFDAPWHHARPTFEEPAPEPSAEPTPGSPAEPAPASPAEPAPEPPADRTTPDPDDDRPTGGTQ